MNSQNKVTLTTHGENPLSVDLPVLSPSMGRDVIDVRGLAKATGMFTFDPGFTATSSCESKSPL